MSILNLTNDTLLVTPTAGAIELADQFYASDANASRGQVERLILNTAQATTSGISKDFTGIPAWAKRITVMFNGVSTSGTSNYLVQIGSGSTTITGYVSGVATGTSYASYTTGFGIVNSILAVDAFSGVVTINLISGASYVAQSVINRPGSNIMSGTGLVTLAGTLDRVRITTVNGTDTFDAGSVNILVEG